jgi:hypothetical protein
MRRGYGRGMRLLATLIGSLTLVVLLLPAHL